MTADPDHSDIRGRQAAGLQQPQAIPHDASVRPVGSDDKVRCSTLGPFAYGVSLIGTACAASVFATSVWAQTNELQVRQIGEDNRASVVQSVREDGAFRSDLPSGGFDRGQPRLTRQREGQRVQYQLPSWLSPLCMYPSVPCPSTDGPSERVALPPGDADRSAGRILQAGRGNTADVMQTGDNSQALVVQAPVSTAASITDPAGITSDTEFDFGKYDFATVFPDNKFEGPTTVGTILDKVTGSGRAIDSVATVTQAGGNNQALAVQSGKDNELLTVQNGNDTGAHVQVRDNNHTRLVQGRGDNTNALVARGHVQPIASSKPFTFRASGGVNMAIEVRGPQPYSSISAVNLGQGQVDINFKR